MKLLLDVRAMFFIGVVVWGCLMFPASGSADVVGKARVVDGDTLAIEGERIRLHGIDAPEQSQNCLLDGADWACGRAATEALKRIVGDRPVECVGHERDRYKRLIAICYVGSLNLNAEMVREGWALAYRRYSHDYIPAENEAESGTRGIWRSDFLPPWEWRKQNRERSSQPSGIERDEKPTVDGVPSSANGVCCKVCKKGKPCGNSCIARNKVCRKAPGCAC